MEDAREGYVQALSLHKRTKSLLWQKKELEREIAEATNIKAITCFSQSGQTVSLVSRERPRVPIIALNDADPFRLPPCGALWLKLEGKNDA